jgi:hypothetical protein
LDDACFQFNCGWHHLLKGLGRESGSFNQQGRYFDPIA